MSKKAICIGMAGAGRATELHMHAYVRVSHVPIRYKTIMAKREEQLVPAKELYGFENYTYDFEEMINDPEIDVIDICTPPYVHNDMIIKALKAGKHVICEKPLTGYFGIEGDINPIGKNVTKSAMYDYLLQSIETLKSVVNETSGKFMYAENFVYAPAVIKASEIIQAKRSKILFIKGEESLKGSSSPVAGEWCKNGGGTFMRTGTHPLSAALWLKQQEAEARGVDIYPVSVMAEMDNLTTDLSEYEHRHIAARPNDVEDYGTAIITFSDKSKAVIMASDVCLGGSKNYVDIYCNDANLQCNLTMNNAMSTYLLDEDGLDDVYLSEMLPSKKGWNYPFVGDELLRGYIDEIQDFMEAVYFDREPKAGFQLAYDTVKVAYAAYKSAELGKRIEL